MTDKEVLEFCEKHNVEIGIRFETCTGERILLKMWRGPWEVDTIFSSYCISCAREWDLALKTTLVHMVEDLDRLMGIHQKKGEKNIMIKIENTQVLGWEPTIRGMRNPMNSWDKSDSEFSRNVDCGIPTSCEHCSDQFGRCSCQQVGSNDLDLMLRLAKAGSVDGKFRRMIVVYVDITAPLYWWKEFDTYKVGTVANSCSTMHKIHAKEFTLEDFSHEHLIDGSGPYFIKNRDPLGRLKETIKELNFWRLCYIDEKAALGGSILYNPDGEEMSKKDYWWQMIQLLPSSYNQKRTVMLNYEVLANIYQHRRNHKLDEWRTLCQWIEDLPYSEIITCNATASTHNSSFNSQSAEDQKKIKELQSALDTLRLQNWTDKEIANLLNAWGNMHMEDLK